MSGRGVCRRVGAAWLGMVWAGLALAEGVDLQPYLAREIVGPVLPIAEVQRYCVERVPAMGSYATADAWQADADRMRADVLEKIVFRGELARQWRDAEKKVEWLDTIEGGPGYSIRKFRYEALPGLWVPGLLYVPEKLSGRVPAILNVNGHTNLGKQYPDKQLRCINQAKRGMLAMNIEWVGMGQLATSGYSHTRMNQLDLCGASGLAPFFLDMQRGIDILLTLENVDPERVAVTGLSGGGWQTIVLSSLDTRVKLCNPVAGYADFRTRAMHLSDLGDSEQTPTDLATVADYAHLTAMLAPRPALLTKNSKDNCCFASGHALPPLLDAARPIYALYGAEDRLRWHVNDEPGTHNYEVDNRQAFYRMLRDFFFPGTAFDAQEIPSESEVKTVEQLLVPLPEPNEDFHTLALAASRSLPHEPELPSADGLAPWQQQRRERLREIVRAKDYEVTAIEQSREERDGLSIVAWRLQMGGWTVPAVEFAQGSPEKTALIVADAGRASTAGEVRSRLDAGYRVVAMDPFYMGESKMAQRDYLFALLVATVGDRPLGLQASQVAATARWLNGPRQGGPVSLVSVGPRSSVFAAAAAGLETQAIATLEMRDPLGSLRQVIDEDWTLNEKPEQFCFGLLEATDMKQMLALVAPRSIVLLAPSDRAKADYADLPAWFQSVGGSCTLQP